MVYLHKSEIWYIINYLLEQSKNIKKTPNNITSDCKIKNINFISSFYIFTMPHTAINILISNVPQLSFTSAEFDINSYSLEFQTSSVIVAHQKCSDWKPFIKG